MKEIGMIAGAAGASFLIAVAFFFKSRRRRDRKALYLSLAFLGIALCLCVVTGYRVVTRTYQKIKAVKLSNPLKARSGDDIYTAMFGPSEHSCMQVINDTDQLIPKLDCCIWLEFETCPAELERIAAQAPYRAESFLAADSAKFIPGYGPRPSWFRPQDMGPRVWVLQNNNPENPNRDQVLLFSEDSSHAFYCDMLD